MEKDANPDGRVRRRALFGIHALNRLVPPTAVTTFDTSMRFMANSVGIVKVGAPTSWAGDRTELGAEMDSLRALTACPAGGPNNHCFRPRPLGK